MEENLILTVNKKPSDTVQPIKFTECSSENAAPSIKFTTSNFTAFTTGGNVSNTLPVSVPSLCVLIATKHSVIFKYNNYTCIQFPYLADCTLGLAKFNW